MNVEHFKTRRVIWFGREIFRWEPRSDFRVLLRWPVVYRRFKPGLSSDLITAPTFVTRWAFVDTDRSPRSLPDGDVPQFACGSLKFLEIS